MAATPGPSQSRRTRHRAAERLVQHIVGGWRCQALHAAVQLELPEALRDGPRSATDLATARACDADGAVHAGRGTGAGGRPLHADRQRAAAVPTRHDR